MAHETSKPSFKFSLPTPDTMIVSACPICGHKETLNALSLIRGIKYLCAECGAEIVISAKSSTSRSVTVRSSNGVEYIIVVREDGVWAFLDENEKAVLEVLEHDSERTIAIVVGSMVESRLQATLLARWQRDEKIEKRLLHPNGALGAFAVKIDLAFLSGLITKEAHTDLVTFKEIRNQFAHYVDIKDFRSQNIKDKAANFHLLEEYVGEFTPGKDGKGTVVDVGAGAMPIIRVQRFAKRKTSPRNRYLYTAQLMLMRLAASELKGDHPLPLI